MARPGTEIRLRLTPPPRSAPTDTGVWFAVGLSDRGPVNTPKAISSLADFERIFGPRGGGFVLYDAIDAYFHEGGGRAYVMRALGASYVTATVTFTDGTGASLRINASAPGGWGNNVSITITAGSAGGTFVISATDSATGITETSPDLVDKAAAIAWAANTQLIRAVDENPAKGDPSVAGSTPLATGANGSAAGDTEFAAALNSATKDLGPGQVSMPARTAAQGQLDLMAHAIVNNRVVLLDAPDSAGLAALQTAANAARAGANERFAAMFWPWVQIPGLVAGTVRTVPPSAIVAGIISRNDGQGLSANQPAAGDDGQLLYGTGLSQVALNDLDRAAANISGIDVIRAMYGGFRVYGFRSLVDSVADPLWINFANARCYMDLAARLDVVADRFEFKDIDGRGILLGQFNGELAAECMQLYQEGALYGNTPDEAFFIDTGPSVNTSTTLQNLELHAVVSVRMSPFAEWTVIEIVKRPITEAVV